MFSRKIVFLEKRYNIQSLYLQYKLQSRQIEIYLSKKTRFFTKIFVNSALIPPARPVDTKMEERDCKAKQFEYSQITSETILTLKWRLTDVTGISWSRTSNNIEYQWMRVANFSLQSLDVEYGVDHSRTSQWCHKLIIMTKKFHLRHLMMSSGHSIFLWHRMCHQIYTTNCLDCWPQTLFFW